MKKGFTLIELLAVILILGIVALIAIPTVSHVVDEARFSAFRSSVIQILKTAEEEYNIKQIKGETISELNFTFDNDKGGLNYKGNDLKSGDIIVDEETVYAVDITDGKFCANGTPENIDIRKGNCSADVINPGRIVYFNPNTGTKCQSSESSSVQGVNSGCMRWYTFEKITSSSRKVDIILDHNTIATVAWSSDTSSNVPVEANQALLSSTADWKTDLNPRFPDANEIAKIVGADKELSWDSTTATWGQWYYFEGAVNGNWRYYITGQGTSSFAWLFDHLKNCTSYGCNYDVILPEAEPSAVPSWTVTGSSAGYWTSTPVIPAEGMVNMAWLVERDGGMGRVSRNVEGAGIRPIITVPVSVVK